MAYKKIAAPLIFIDGTFQEGKVIIIDLEGEIISIENVEIHDQSSVHLFPNAIVPGFINAHCHLELSHMKGLVPTGTTLIPFIKSVITKRDNNPDDIFQAIKDNDEYMYNHGIVAVGDISNKADTSMTKNNSRIHYYTFIEMFDMMQPYLTAKTIDQYSKVYEEQSQNDRNKKSFVPHAPYSVSKELFKFINTNNDTNATVSIHNQETLAENELFLHKQGAFLEFYKSLDLSLDLFEKTGKSSIHEVIKYMDCNQKTLLVHNVQTNADDIFQVNKWSNKIYWATCPNANLYIENRLPDYKLFIDSNQRLCIGTDSLTSNWQLSIFEEIKTIYKYCSYIPLEMLITWATKNGAEALGYEHLGEIAIGKKPSFVHVPIKKVGPNNYIILNEEEKIITP